MIISHLLFVKQNITVSVVPDRQCNAICCARDVNNSSITPERKHDFISYSWDTSRHVLLMRGNIILSLDSLILHIFFTQEKRTRNSFYYTLCLACFLLDKSSGEIHTFTLKRTSVREKCRREVFMRAQTSTGERRGRVTRLINFYLECPGKRENVL